MRTVDLSSPDFLTVAEGATYTRANFGGAKVSFTLPVARFTQCPFTNGELIKLLYRGQTLLIGPVVQPAHTLDAGAEQWQIEIHDYWWSLENTIYLNLTAGNNRSRGILAQRDADGNIVPVAKMKDALSAVLSHAINTAGIPIAYELRIDDAAEIIPFAYSTASYANLIAQIQKWRPNMSAFFEYGTDDGITLVLADYDQLTPLTLDIDAIDVGSISLKPRHDLVPPAIGLIANATVDGQTVRSARTYPADANLHQPYVVTAEIDVPEDVSIDGTDAQGAPVTGTTGGSNAKTPRMLVRGKKLLPITQEHIRRWFPALAETELEIDNDTVRAVLAPVEDFDHLGYEAQLLEYELTSGQINGKTKKLKWSKTRLTVTVTATEPPETTLSLFPENLFEAGKRRGAITVDVVTTNVSRCSYLLDKNGTNLGGGDSSGTGDDDEEETQNNYDVSIPYDQFIKSYYAATRATPYDGNIRVLDHIPVFVGATLSITGGLPEWQTMQTIIQSIELDLQTNVANLTVGAPEHISLQDSIDKSKQLAELNRRTTEANATTNVGDGTGAGVSPSDKSDKEKRPDLPSIGPNVTVVGGGAEPTTVGSSRVPAAFQATPLFHQTQTGEIIGARINGGSVFFGSQSKLVTEKTLSIGKAYLNAKIDIKTGTIEEAAIEASPQTHNPSPTVYPHTTGDGTFYLYSILLATAAADNVTQHRIGDIDLPMQPTEADALDLSVTAPIKQANGALYLDVCQTPKSVTVAGQEIMLALKINDEGQLDLNLSVSSLDPSVTS